MVLMINGIGVVVILVCVFGSFMLSGGNLLVILGALPHELMAIVGAAAGAFMLSNSGATIRKAWAGTKLVFRGPHWREKDYRDLLSLMFSLLLLFRKGGAAKMENHIDAPFQSSIFSAYPRLLADSQLIDYICDYLRMITMSFDDPHQIAEAMEMDAERHHTEELLPARALQIMADGLPALGIVAAMIGGALVGTFLGVLLSYCFVGPIASKLHQIIDEDAKPYQIVKTAIVAYVQGVPTQVAVELARRMTPSAFAPSFQQLETALEEASDRFQLAKAA
jgi:chemotaxis protein MotA